MSEENTGVKNATLVKWLLVAGGAAIGAYYLIPILLTIAWGILEFALLGAAVVAVVFLYPAFCEALANFGYYLWEMAIKSNAMPRLRRDANAMASRIDNYEEAISGADAAIDEAVRAFQMQKDKLDEDEKAAFNERIGSLREAYNDMLKERDNMVKEYQDFCLAIEKYEAKDKLAKAFSIAASSFAFSSKSGANSAGAKVAADDIDRRLSQSHAKIKMMLSRPETKLPTLASRRF